ncbi:MAG TPA: hypothetical protein VMV53_04110 [Acidimicrobiales bacterium]|nr:hypothetical protein [Acidimicrobiales bacterium]
MHNEDLLEECLVEHPLDVIRRLFVSRSTVSREIECPLEISLDCLELRQCGRHSRLNLAKRPADPILLATKQIDWYRSGIVRLHELLALALHLLLLALQVGSGLLHPCLSYLKLFSN